MNDNKSKDKEYELGIEYGGAKGSLKIKNSNNRVVAKIGDTIVDALSYFRWNNAVKFLDKYNKKKAKRNIEGKETPLPPKFLIEILDNAFQEDNDTLQDKWNNLLINWQDLEKNCDIKYMYIDILKNLGLNEIRVLKLMKEDANFEKIKVNKTLYYNGNVIRELLNLTPEDYELTMLNLYRLKVCDSIKTEGNLITLGELPVRADGGIEKFRYTIIGYNLIKSIQD